MGFIFIHYLHLYVHTYMHSPRFYFFTHTCIYIFHILVGFGVLKVSIDHNAIYGSNTLGSSWVWCCGLCLLPTHWTYIYGYNMIACINMVVQPPACKSYFTFRIQSSYYHNSSSHVIRHLPILTIF